MMKNVAGRELAEAGAGICVLMDDIYLGMPRFMRSYAGLCGLVDLSCGNSVGFVRLITLLLARRNGIWHHCIYNFDSSIFCLET